MFKDYRLQKGTLMQLIGHLTGLCQSDDVFKVNVVRWQDKRSIIQNAKLHAMISDISKQVEWHGKKFNVVTWKRLCTASWLREEGEQPELIPALDGNGFDLIFEKTSGLGVKKMAMLIEWTYAFGAEYDVKWSEPIPADYEAFARMNHE